MTGPPRLLVRYDDGVYQGTRRRRYARRRAVGILAFVAVAALVLLGALSACSALTGGEGAFSGPDGTANPEEEAATNDAPAGGQNAPEQSVAEPQRAGNPEVRQEPVRAVYLTAPSVDNLDAYLQFADETDVNAFVVDVKDVTGEVMYRSEVPLANEIGATRDILDLDSLLAELEERDIYAIARIATFEDDILPVARPDLAVTDTATGSQWTNYVGNYWSDPYSREVWEYNAAIAKEVSEAGFDEVQFDYVRFPSDGPMERLSYPSEPEEGSDANPIAGFLEYADGELEGTDARIAADVFGLAAGENGAGVGQDIAAFAPHVDVLNPMIYPSHYPVGSYDIQNPNARPYRVVSESMTEFTEAVSEANPEVEIRPWLQDFTQGPPEYGPEEVSAQIRAVYDSGEKGWLLWNAANIYTDAALRDTDAEDYASDAGRR